MTFATRSPVAVNHPGSVDPAGRFWVWTGSLLDPNDTENRRSREGERFSVWTGSLLDPSDTQNRSTGETAGGAYGRHMITVAVVAAIAYFAGFGAGFIFRPELVERFALRWTDPAGRTEVRCYYGAVSWAIAGFLTYLLANDLEQEALVGVLLLACSVFAVRVLGTVIDGGRDHPYTRMALPLEAAFVAAISLVLFLA